MYVKCPECSTVMNRTNFAKRSGIIIDSCKGHGTWFDSDELPRIVEFVMNGGIEAANERELARAKEEIRRQQAKLRAGKSADRTPFRGGRLERNRSVDSFSSLLGAIGLGLFLGD